MRLATAVVVMIGSSYSAMLLDMVRGVLLMRLLGPTGRGIQRGVNLLTSYLDNVHLGVRHGISKRLPQAIATDDSEAADAVEDISFTFILLTTTIAALAILAWAALDRDLQTATAVSVALGGVLLLGQQADGLYQVVLRAFGSFRILAKARIVFSAAQFAGMVLGAWRGGIIGAMVGWVVAYLALMVYYHFAARWRVKLRLRWDIVWRLIVIGVWIALMTLSDVLLRSVEGIIIVKYYKVYGLGLYGAATQAAGCLYAVAQAAQFVIWPRLLDCHARNGMGEQTRKNVVLPTVAVATLMPAVCGAAYFLLPPVISALVPRFSEAIAATQVLSMSVCLLALPIAANTLLVATDREGLVTMFRGAGAALIAGLSLMVVRRYEHPPLELFAYCAASGYLVAGVLALCSVMKSLYSSARKRLAELTVFYAPTAWAVAVVYAVGIWGAAVPGWDQRSWIAAFVKTAIYLIATIPVLIYADIRLKLRQELRRMYLELRGNGAGIEPPETKAGE
jgi:O-antigen/teichoic acid export membrane protein